MDGDTAFTSSRDDAFSSLLEYSQMIVPSTMRSQYWKYFGFPSDNFSNIITKKKVICTLCNTAISYNKNTTNLRTHLVAKHPDTLYEMTNEKKLKLENSSLSQGQKRIKVQDSKKPTLKELDCIQVITDSHKINEQDAIIEALTEGDEIIIKENKCKINESNEFQDYSSTLDHQSYQIEEIDETNIQSDENISVALQDMLIKDLLPPSIVTGSGFINLLWTLCPNFTVPDRKEVEKTINKSHNTNFINILEEIKSHSADNVFSLGFEIWENVEKKELINIYVNYILQKENPIFNSVLLKTVELSQSTNLDENLEGINMKNCSTAVVNFENDVVTSFLNNHDLPYIPCFETAIQNCLASVFKMPSVAIVLKDIANILEKNDLCENDEIPQIQEKFPITKFNFLSFFHKKVSNSYPSWNEELIVLLDKAKEIIECLSPLNMTLETISDEPVALCSLLKPLTTKLLNQHFCFTDEDSQIILDIKEIIIQKLSCILNNKFLIVSSFLDPRFQNFTDSECLQVVKETIRSKYQNVIMEDVKTESKDENDNGNIRISNLKLFFKSDEIKRHPKVSKSSLDVEITKYISEVCADLEQCPLTWWNEYRFVYRQLKTISESYMCVPASFTSVFKRSLSECIDYYNRRYMLKENTDMNLLFLHVNR